MREASIEDIRLEIWLRERNDREIRWKTKDGTEIPIRDMSLSHLRNVERMLERNEHLSEIACEYRAYIDDLD